MAIVLCGIIIAGVLALLAFATIWAEPAEIEEATPEQAGILAASLGNLISGINEERL